MLRKFISKSGKEPQITADDNEIQLANQLNEFSTSLTQTFADKGEVNVKVFKEEFKSNSTSYAEAIDKIPKKLKKDALVFGNNNLNISFTNGRTSIVYQCSELPACHEDLMKSLKDTGATDFFAKTYGTPISLKSKKLVNDPNDMNSFDRSLRTVGSFVENLTPLEVRIEQTKDNNERLTLAAEQGVALCNMLTKLAENKVIWSDMKPGNILLRPDGSLAIADKKGFYPVDKIELRINRLYKSVDGNIQLLAELPVSPSYLSNGHASRILNPTFQSTNTLADDAKVTRSMLLQEWQKEYSYQLAIVLYVIATKEKDQDYMHNQAQGFDFNKDIFKNSIFADNLKNIIEGLSHEDPNKRMTVDTALQNLQHLANVLKGKFTEIETAKHESPAVETQGQAEKKQWAAVTPRPPAVKTQRKAEEKQRAATTPRSPAVKTQRQAEEKQWAAATPRPPAVKTQRQAEIKDPIEQNQEKLKNDETNTPGGPGIR